MKSTVKILCDNWSEIDISGPRLPLHIHAYWARKNRRVRGVQYQFFRVSPLSFPSVYTAAPGFADIHHYTKDRGGMHTTAVSQLAG